jgi:hypothetical protein
MYLGRACHLLWPVLLLSVVVTLHPLSLYPQTASPDSGKAVPKVKSNVRLVLVDAVVTNSKGDAVTGLHAEDFEVLEDGKPQTISTFEEHHGAPPTQIKLPSPLQYKGAARRPATGAGRGAHWQ